MKATLEYNDEQCIDVDIPLDGIVPLVSYAGKLFVLRSYVLGILDTGNTNSPHYHQTEIVEAKPSGLLN